MGRTADEIGRLLLDVAYDEDVNILKAKDYGSRARSLESSDSDYDVLFVFAQSYPEYVVRTEYVDTIERTFEPPHEIDLDAEVELHGWNIRKFIGGEDFRGNTGGILGSDAMAMEFIASDIEYHTAPTINGSWEDLESHTAENFKPYALIGHYRSLAVSNYRKYLDDAGATTTDVTAKRYNNVLQALFKRKYVRDTHKMPPMDANDLLRSMAGVIPEGVYGITGRLFVQKRDSRGDDPPPEGDRVVLDEWIEEEIEQEEDPGEHIGREPDPEMVAHYVSKILNDTC